MRAFNPRLVGSLLLLAASATSAHAGETTRFYVDDDQTNPGDGNSWASAFTHLGAAIHEAGAIAAEGDNVEIFVAAGLYRPDQSEEFPLGSQDASLSFLMQERVSIFGHFAGTETSIGERDFQNPNNASVLSGDLGDLDGSPVNSHHVVFGESTYDGPSPSRIPVLDGFTISGGLAKGGTFDTERGGGFYAYTGKHRLHRCVIENNEATYGGGVAIAYAPDNVTTSELELIQCEIRNNTAFGGGGAYILNGEQSFHQVLCHGNSATWGGGVFADLFLRMDTTVDLSQVSMGNNVAQNGGDDVYVDQIPIWPFLQAHVFLRTASTLYGSQSPWRFDGLSVVSPYDPNGLRGGWSGVTGSNIPSTTSGFFPVFDGQQVYANAAAGDLRISNSNQSPLDFGSDPSNSLQADIADLDNDGDVNELTPIDFAGTPRDLGSELQLGAFASLDQWSTYCFSLGNSTGSRADLQGFGTTDPNNADLMFIASPVPNSTGIIFFGPNQIDLPFGNGRRCIGGSVRRMPAVAATGNVLRYEFDWNFVWASDLQPGTTWKFQAWFRDIDGGGSEFNTSDAITIDF